MHWEADTSLIDAAREIAIIIQKHNQEAERAGRGVSRVVRPLVLSPGRSRLGRRRSGPRATVANSFAAPDSARNHRYTMDQVLVGLQSALEGRYVLERELGRGGISSTTGRSP